MQTDRQIRQDVLDELKWDPSVHADAIAVGANNGIVVLSGHVPSFAQKRAAEQAAQRVAGVRGVVMELGVSLPGSSVREDEDLAQAAMHALDWNAIVPKDAVRIVVNNGWITLGGEVDRARSSGTSTPRCTARCRSMRTPSRSTSTAAP